MTSAYFKYRILTYVNMIFKTKIVQNSQKYRTTVSQDRIKDLQMHSLYTITKVVKYLHEQSDQALVFFKENKLGEIDLEYTVGEAKRIRERQESEKNSMKQASAVESIDAQMNTPELDEIQKLVNCQDSCIYQKNLPIDSIFVLQEQDIVDSYNDSFAVSWRTISQIEEDSQTQD